ncbi:methyltransferase domain-containing protein [Kitasatospora sp. RB6PN24]|uniref:class I SAM-dependent methyltransferase n=1 Tax=Kitasatospora humi TaxID=2893891 RepID=UPI001E61AA76|nr:class I SAM-dependent methyltransferase [Kitasatospora humi]MCC9306295.1 methyltransferase domain-containing protein [Kitasatospora humi]
MADHTHHHHHHHGGDGGPEAAEREAALAEMLDLDAELLHSLHSEVVDLVAEHAGRVRRFVDLGSGTGAGTFALLARFPEAEAIAVDGSPQMTERLLGTAETSGTASRVRAIEADLDEAWPDFGGELDLAWSATAMHHMAQPARAMREVFEALRPGGLFALVEIDSQPRFLPEELGIGRPGLEDRCRALLEAQLAVELPYLGADWGPLLTGAGFEVAAERRFTAEPTPTDSKAAGRYAQLVLRGLRDRVAGLATADDLAVLDQLTADDGPHSVLRRDDLTVRAERQVWLGRRPVE